MSMYEIPARFAAPPRVNDMIEKYRQVYRSDEPSVSWSVLADFVVDILHYADSHNIDAEQVLRVALRHYADECDEVENLPIR